jgi:RNA polymerase sigma factor for flagellar operon FliA
VIAQLPSPARRKVATSVAAYAKMRVRGAMVDLIRRSSAGTRGASERRRRIEQASVALRGRLGRDPQPAELAAHLGLSLHEFEALRDAAQPVSFEPLDEAYADSDTRFADSTPNGLEALLESELRESLIVQIAALPERLQLVIQLYFIEELSLAEIAEVMQVSIPRVHQLKARALETLREGLQHLAEMR